MALSTVVIARSSYMFGGTITVGNNRNAQGLIRCIVVQAWGGEPYGTKLMHCPCPPARLGDPAAPQAPCCPRQLPMTLMQMQWRQWQRPPDQGSPQHQDTTLICSTWRIPFTHHTTPCLQLAFRPSAPAHPCCLDQTMHAYIFCHPYTLHYPVP